MALSNQPQPRRPEDWFPPARPTGGATVTDLVELAPLLYTYVAGETLGGHRAVYVADDGLAYIAEPDNAEARILAGITTSAVDEGDPVSIQADGIIENLGWSWTGTEPVWLTASGLLTQTPPVINYLVQVGVPVGPTQLRVAPQFIAFIGA